MKTNNKELYLVCADTCQPYDYGVCVQIVGLYDDKEEAEKIIEKITNDDKWGWCDVWYQEIELNRQYLLADIFGDANKETITLASYIE